MSQVYAVGSREHIAHMYRLNSGGVNYDKVKSGGAPKLNGQPVSSTTGVEVSISQQAKDMFRAMQDKMKEGA